MAQLKLFSEFNGLLQLRDGIHMIIIRYYSLTEHRVAGDLWYM